MQRSCYQLFLSLCLVLPLMLTGCATGIPGFDWDSGSTIPGAVPNPYRSGHLPVGFWEEVEQLEGTRPLTRWSYKSFPIPFFVTKSALEISPDRRSAAKSDYDLIGFGFPEFYFPLFFNSSKTYYEKGNLSPVGRAARHYHPLYSGSTMDGKTDGNPTFEAAGFPILAEWGTESGDAWYFSEYEKKFGAKEEITFDSLVWWLGPAWGKKTRIEPGGLTKTETKAFFPSYFAKNLGPFFWSDYQSVKTLSDDSTKTIRGHGPIFGLPTWFEYESTTPEGKAFETRLLLGGILWWDRDLKNEFGYEYESHGPLWNMFGYSEKKTEYATRKRLHFFWIPIQIGKEYDTEALLN